MVLLAHAYPKVQVQFYEESGCPDCQDFIQNYLNQTLTAPGVGAVMELKIFPWGNAYYNISSCPSAPSYDRTIRECWVTKCAPQV